MSGQGPRRTPSTDSSTTTSTASLKGSRAARFAEATSVNSPIDGPNHSFASDRSQVYHAQPADVGFGYLNEKTRESVYMPASPRSPMKSAMKSPGAPGRKLENPLSPTFREEDLLEKREKSTDKEQAKDLKVKTRVRMAKAALRGVNFSCSLIILSMVSTSFAIFNATRALPQQSGAPSWASDTNTLPQKIILVAASISLIICVGVFIAYCRGGHRRAEKVGVYYALFAVGWFILSMIMWAAAAGVLQFSKDNSSNRDMWGWSCVQNHRSEIYNEKVDYALVCRLQNWTLICIIIEIVVEVISITLYSVIFYRYYTKRRLTKSMDSRDKARTDLYLAQLRNQSAPNTPGFAGPKSPALSNYALSPRFPEAGFQSMSDANATPSPFSPGGKSLVEPQSSFASRNGAGSSPASPTGAPFKLQMPPQKAPSATPKLTGSAFSAAAASTSAPPKGSKAAAPVHGPVAPGEMQYEAVAIPEAYPGAAVKSPPAAKTTFR